MADPTKTGQQYPSFTWTVEREKIVELMRTIGDDNELFLDRDTARSEGYRDIPAPPTLITMPFCWNRLFPVIAADLDMDPARILRRGGKLSVLRRNIPGRRIDRRAEDNRCHRKIRKVRAHGCGPASDRLQKPEKRNRHESRNAPDRTKTG